MAMTTADLQTHPTDFVILPQEVGNSGLVHSATGVFLNDNGIDLNVSGKQNIYQLDFESVTDQSKATLNFKTTLKATDEINKNDYLGQIDILGASKVPILQGANLNVTVQWSDSTEWVLGNVAYNATSERIVVPKQPFDIKLSNVTKLTFAPVTV